jgi:hypothetical protein
MSKLTSVVAALLVCSACGKSDPQWLADLKPKMQSALDTHVNLLSAVVPLAVDGPTVPCSGAVETTVPSLSDATLKTFAAGGVKIYSWEHGKQDFLAGEAYVQVVGGSYLISSQYIEPAVAQLANPQEIGVFLPKTVDKGKAEDRAIIRPGKFEGTFVLVDVTGPAPRVIGRVPVTARTNDFITHSGEGAQAALEDNLERNVREAAEKACPGVRLTSKPAI